MSNSSELPHIEYLTFTPRQLKEEDEKLFEENNISNEEYYVCKFIDGKLVDVEDTFSTLSEASKFAKYKMRNLKTED